MTGRFDWGEQVAVEAGMRKQCPPAPNLRLLPQSALPQDNWERRGLSQPVLDEDPFFDTLL